MASKIMDFRREPITIDLIDEYISSLHYKTYPCTTDKCCFYLFSKNLLFITNRDYYRKPKMSIMHKSITLLELGSKEHIHDTTAAHKTHGAL